MRVHFSGGRFDGTEMDVANGLDVVSFPLLSPRDNKAVTVSDDEVKRHSWDDDALNSTYLDYYKTPLEADDGTVIFVPKEKILQHVLRPHRFESISEEQWKSGKPRHMCNLCGLDYGDPIHVNE